MSYGAGHVMDMINRMKQNRALRPSKRSKFKEHHRDTMLADPDRAAKKPVFKKVSEEELAAIKAQIQHNAQKQTQREKTIWILSGLFVIASIFALYLYF